MDFIPKHIYVAGPLDNEDPGIVQDNIATALADASMLIHYGHFPFIPHLLWFLHHMAPRSRETWLEYDLAWLARCDALLRLEGPSEGRDLEVLEARRLSIPVFSSLSAFIDAHGDGSLR